MSTWRRGVEILERLAAARSGKLETLINHIGKEKLARVPGSAVFLTGYVEDCPATLRHHAARNQALHEQVILLTAINNAMDPTEYYQLPADRTVVLGLRVRI